MESDQFNDDAGPRQCNKNAKQKNHALGAAQILFDLLKMFRLVTLKFYFIFFFFLFCSFCTLSVCLTWLYDNMMETTCSEREKKFFSGGGFMFVFVCRCWRLSGRDSRPLHSNQTFLSFFPFDLILPLFNFSPLSGESVPFSSSSRQQFPLAGLTSCDSGTIISFDSPSKNRGITTGGNWSRVSNPIQQAKLYPNNNNKTSTER